jgi:hypothetical protein
VWNRSKYRGHRDRKGITLANKVSPGQSHRPPHPVYGHHARPAGWGEWGAVRHNDAGLRYTRGTADPFVQHVVQTLDLVARRRYTELPMLSLST